MHRMRCSRGKLGCGKRFSLRRPPWHYIRTPRCPRCKSVHVQSVEQERRREMQIRYSKGKLCMCGYYPFPHAAATLRFCSDHPNMDDPSEAEWAHYEHILRTPRGGCGIYGGGYAIAAGTMR